MKLDLRPTMALQTIRKAESIIQVLAVAALVCLGAAYIVQLYISADTWMRALTGIEQALAIVSALLVASAVIIRTIIMRNPTERLMPSRFDSRSLKMLQDLVFEWMRGQASDDYERHWRFIEGEDDLATLVRLNHEGFALSSYSAEIEILERRNRALWEKNPQTFSLIFDPIRNTDVIGYSCMLPLNAEACRLYLDGGFMDKHVSALHIAAPHEEYAAIVVFAIVMDKAYSQHWKRGNRSHLASFISAVIDHGNVISAQLQPDGYFLAQSEKTSIEMLLRALYFEPTEHVSAEGFPFYRLQKGKLREQASRAGVAMRPAGR